MTQTRRHFHRLAMATTMLGAVPAMAQERWPQRPLRIIVPYSPGASTDNVTRRMAQELSPRLGQTVIVENKTGAMGTIGMAEVARARPDGYTFLGMDSGFTILPHLVRSTPFDTPRDFMPIAAYVFMPLSLVVNTASPYRTLQDLVDKARAEPGKLTFGSGGIGTFPQMATDDLASRLGITLMHVPFRGASEAVQALLAGTIDLQIAAPATVLGNVGPTGRLRMLAIGGAHRLPQLPDVPTFMEAGVRDFVLQSWIGLFAPRGTAQPVIDRLAREAVAIMNTPEIKAYAESIAAEPRVVVGDELTAMLSADDDRWKGVIERVGLVPQ
ncbi:MAG TPA: tripartite tricarboxylate transporter substrate binding protein [Roseomonas sp.]|jgi:tripartite-type tricarboxylate transporter receptor subunit TctC